MSINNFWVALYLEIFDKDWFKDLVSWYYDGESEDIPISMLDSFGGIEMKDVHEILHGTSGEMKIPDSKLDQRWWIIPCQCYITNGVFLYTIFKKLGRNNIKIYEKYGEDFHVFLKEDDYVYDMYYASIGKEYDYLGGEEISEDKFIKKYFGKALEPKIKMFYQMLH